RFKCDWSSDVCSSDLGCPSPMGERGECLHTPAQCPPEDPLPHATAPAHPSTPPTFTGLVPWEASSQWYRVFIDTGSRPRLWNRGRANETAPVHHPSLGRSGRMAAHGTRAAAERSATDRLSGWEKSVFRPRPHQRLSAGVT